MMIFSEAQKVLVYCWDLNTRLFTSASEYQVEPGFGLPAGMTMQAPETPSGKVAVRNIDAAQWDYVDDDRGRSFYFKLSGEEYRTTLLNEEMDSDFYTKQAPPELEEGQLTHFDDDTQSWLVGVDWYNQNIWNAQQQIGVYLGDFFILNREQTNIEPPTNAVDYVLNDSGHWIKPVTAYHKDTGQAESFVIVSEVPSAFTLSRPFTNFDVWMNDAWVTDLQAKYDHDYEKVKSERESLYRQMVDPLEGEAARKARQGRMDEAQRLYEQIDALEVKIQTENPYPTAPTLQL